VPDAVITVICTHDDGWRYHPKYMQSSLQKYNKLYIVSYCWTVIDIITKKLKTRVFVGQDRPSFRILQTKQIEKKEVAVFVIEAEYNMKLTASILQLTTALRREMYTCKEGEKK
jgi:hypothetical protein